ncbi:MAG: FlgD immunoglobulin-like domain containing protein, partial [Planctomycetota bacterium]
INDAWIDGFTSRHNLVRGNVSYSFGHARAAWQDPRVRVVNYLNAKGIRFDTPEYHTFMDEWHVDEFMDQRSGWGLGEGACYSSHPTESYIDYVTYYVRKIADHGMPDGSYFDDIYLWSGFDIVGGGAYELPDGSVRGSVGLWGQRELVRRTAMVYHEMGKQPLVMPHVTNTSTTPVLAFVQWQLVWEDKDRIGPVDFQDRFPKDYTRCGSIGRQQGVIPYALVLEAGTDWLSRTAAGAVLTHELKTEPNTGDPSIYWDNFDRLLDFGYGQPENGVSNYWEENHPISVTGPDNANLFVAKPDSAMIIITDYDNGGDYTISFDQSLGINGDISVRNAETGSSVSVDGGRTIRFNMGRHDFIVLKVSAPGLRFTNPVAVYDTSYIVSEPLILKALSGNAPGIKILYTLSRRDKVKLSIYSLKGRLVRTLVEGPVAAGQHTLFWDGLDAGRNSVASGNYVVRLSKENYAVHTALRVLK